MAKSPADAAQTMIDNMPDKTGKPLKEWLSILQKTDLIKHGQIVKFLKTEHGVTHGFANLIAHKALAQGNESAEDDLVNAQYGGPKATLRPIYEKLIADIKTFGPDVEFAPKKSYVSLRRNKQFGLIQPSTKTRVDVGLNLKGVEATERLEASGSFNAMVSHRVRLSHIDDVDAELLGWLRSAYEAS